MSEGVVRRVKRIISETQDTSTLHGEHGTSRKDCDVVHFEGVEELDISRVAVHLARHHLRAFLRTGADGPRLDVYVPKYRVGKRLVLACLLAWAVFLALLAMRRRALPHSTLALESIST